MIRVRSFVLERLGRLMVRLSGGSVVVLADRCLDEAVCVRCGHVNPNATRVTL